MLKFAWILVIPFVVSGTTTSSAPSIATSHAATSHAAEVPVAGEPPLVAWRDVAEKPCRWLGRKLRMRLQYESEPSEWNPYLTRFGRGQFDAVRAWSDEQYPWIESDYSAPAARVFVRKGSLAQHAFVGAKPYMRFELTAVVREVFLEAPWVEIVDVRPMFDCVTEATVIHAGRALELMDRGAWDLAILELDEALGAPAPDSALIELGRLRDECATAVAAAAPAKGRPR